MGWFAGMLEIEVTNEEILEVVCSLGRNRAPGRDGVTTSFFKCFWEIVREQVIKACLEFFDSGFMDACWKETVVVLVPKVKNQDHPSKFRPISLCQTIYKIVAKVFVNRMKGVMPKLIYEKQVAFAPGHSISNHCLLGKELINKFKAFKLSSSFFGFEGEHGVNL